ncbi:MAG: ABC transporter permease [Candidatus Dormiibacterota bacterium]
MARSAAVPLVTAGTLALGLLGWQLLSYAVPPYLLPPPGAVVLRWGELVQSGVLGQDLAVTTEEAALGFALASVLALSLGYAVARLRVLEELLAPYIAASQAMPMVAFAPLLITWLGIGILPKVLIAALIIFFPILVNTVVALRGIDRDLVDAARTDGASAGRILFHVEAPLALPIVLGGVKMGLTLAMTGALVAEFIATDAGLGYLLNLGRTEYDGAMVFAAALSVAAVSILAYACVTAVERAVRRRV